MFLVLDLYVGTLTILRIAIFLKNVITHTLLARRAELGFSGLATVLPPAVGNSSCINRVQNWGQEGPGFGMAMPRARDAQAPADRSRYRTPHGHRGTLLAHSPPLTARARCTVTAPWLSVHTSVRLPRFSPRSTSRSPFVHTGRLLCCIHRSGCSLLVPRRPTRCALRPAKAAAHCALPAWASEAAGPGTPCPQGMVTER